VRYFLDIAYKGTNYHGWQIQKNAHTIQAEIQSKISLLLKEKIEVVGSGRTDTGVHAKQQIAHFDIGKELGIQDFLHKINSFLPKDIVIKDMYEVAKNIHARFDAKKRTYEYIINRKKNPFFLELAYFYPKKLDLEQMNLASQKLLLYEDFECFSKVKTEVNHFLCEVFEAYWEEEVDKLIFRISANRFLRGMVRAIVGTLLEVGLGRKNIIGFEKIVQNKNRRNAGFAVPAQGLYLVEVTYTL